MADLLARVHKFNAVPAASTRYVDVSVHGSERLVVMYVATDATAGADLGAPKVTPYDIGDAQSQTPDAPQQSIIDMTPTATYGPQFSAPRAERREEYDTRGYGKVRIRLLNAAASARNMEIHVFVYRPS